MSLETLGILTASLSAQANTSKITKCDISFPHFLSPGAGALPCVLKLSSSKFKEMRWRRHSHSYSEGELSKSAAVGRASSRGHEGHRFEFKIENFLSF